MSHSINIQIDTKALNWLFSSTISNCPYLQAIIVCTFLIDATLLLDS